MPLLGQCDVNGTRICAKGNCYKQNTWFSQCLQTDACEFDLLCHSSCPRGWACQSKYIYYTFSITF